MSWSHKSVSDLIHLGVNHAYQSDRKHKRRFSDSGIRTQISVTPPRVSSPGKNVIYPDNRLQGQSDVQYETFIGPRPIQQDSDSGYGSFNPHDYGSFHLDFESADVHAQSNLETLISHVQQYPSYEDEDLWSLLQPEEIEIDLQCLPEPDSRAPAKRRNNLAADHRASRPAKPSREKRFCDLCETTKSSGFSTVNDLARHKRSVHGFFEHGDKIWRCRLSDCTLPDKIWARRDTFITHIRRVHNNGKYQNVPEIADHSLEHFDPEIHGRLDLTNTKGSHRNTRSKSTYKESQPIDWLASPGSVTSSPLRGTFQFGQTLQQHDTTISFIHPKRCATRPSSEAASRKSLQLGGTFSPPPDVGSRARQKHEMDRQDQETASSEPHRVSMEDFISIGVGVDDPAHRQGSERLSPKVASVSDRKYHNNGLDPRDAFRDEQRDIDQLSLGAQHTTAIHVPTDGIVFTLPDSERYSEYQYEQSQALRLLLDGNEEAKAVTLLQEFAIQVFKDAKMESIADVDTKSPPAYLIELFADFALRFGQTRSKADKVEIRDARTFIHRYKRCVLY